MQSEVDGYSITWQYPENSQTSVQLEDWKQPPTDHRWCGPWEPFAVMDNMVVWRRPYTWVPSND